MPFPTAYANEREFALWMHGILKKVAVFLDWSVAVDGPGSYQNAINEALSVYGEPSITAVTDIGKLQKIGRVELWRSVAEATVSEFDWSATDDGATYSRSQVHRQALAMMNLAMADIAYLYRSLPRYAGRSVKMVPKW